MICGSSSRYVARKNAPTRVWRGSRPSPLYPPMDSAYATIERNFIRRNVFPSFLMRRWMKNAEHFYKYPIFLDVPRDDDCLNLLLRQNMWEIFRYVDVRDRASVFRVREWKRGSIYFIRDSECGRLISELRVREKKSCEVKRFFRNSDK